MPEKIEERGVEKLREELRKAGKTAEEMAKKIGTGLGVVAERASKIDVPRLVKGVMLLSTTGMTLYVVGVSVATMLPYAIPVFAQFGTVLGYMIPLMFMATVFSIIMALVKYVVK